MQFPGFRGYGQQWTTYDANNLQAAVDVAAAPLCDALTGGAEACASPRAAASCYEFRELYDALAYNRAAELLALSQPPPRDIRFDGCCIQEDDACSTEWVNLCKVIVEVGVETLAVLFGDAMTINMCQVYQSTLEHAWQHLFSSSTLQALRTDAYAMYDMAAVGRHISNCTTLHTLHLYGHNHHLLNALGNGLGDHYVPDESVQLHLENTWFQQLCTAVAACRSLKTVVFDHYSMNGPGEYELLFDALANGGSVDSLRMYNSSPYTINFVQALAAWLSSQGCTLRWLYLGADATVWPVDSLELLLTALKANSSLQHCDVTVASATPGLLQRWQQVRAGIAARTAQIVE